MFNLTEEETNVEHLNLSGVNLHIVIKTIDRILHSYVVKAGMDYHPIVCNNLRYMKYLFDGVNSGAYPRTPMNMVSVGYYLINYLEEKLERDLTVEEMELIDCFIRRAYSTQMGELPKLINRYKVLGLYEDVHKDIYEFLYQCEFKGLNGIKFVVAIDKYMIALRVTAIYTDGKIKTYLFRVSPEVEVEHRDYLDVAFPEDKCKPPMSMYADTLICELWNIEKYFSTKVSDDIIHVYECSKINNFESELNMSPLREISKESINGYSRMLGVNKLYTHKDECYLLEIGLREYDFVMTVWKSTLDNNVISKQWFLDYTKTYKDCITMIKDFLLGDKLLGK